MRLVVASLCVSVALAIVVSATQLYFAYKQNLSSALTVFSQVESSYRHGLEAALWEVNTEGIDNLLDAIAKSPNVGKVSLVDETKHIFTRNNDAEPPFAHKDFNLQYVEGNSHFELGTLHVELTRRDIIAQLQAIAIQNAITVFFALFGNSIFVLIMFHWWISRHLVKIAKFTTELDAENIGSTLTLDRPHAEFDDELDFVVNALNRMQRSLKDELTAREQIEKELRTHRDNLELLVEERTLAYKSSSEQLEIAATIAELGVWSWNIVEDRLQWNDRMFEMYSQPLELRKQGLKFKHWRQRLHPESADAAVSEVMSAIEHAGIYSAQFRIITPMGSMRHIKARAQVVCDTTGKAILLTGINQDITDQVELQTRLIQAKEQADAASAAKSAFLANMSHEIRTPMNAVLGMLQLVQKTGLNHRQRDYIEKAYTAAKSLLMLLNDILDYSKIEAGKLDLDLHTFELETLLCDLAVILSGNQGQKDVDIIFDIPTTLPTVLIGDSLRLQQTLINLAGNALKFTLHGYVKVSVAELNRSNNSLQLRFAVSDSGIGISTEQQAHLFDAFSQAERSTTRRFGGTGLGLTISQRLVDLMGGSLQLRSELGHGSEFWFDISLSIADATHAPPAPTSLAGLRILVVDDNTITCTVMARTIEAFGGHAEYVTESRIAVEKVNAGQQTDNRYDVVLMDWRMPDLDGVSAAKMICDKSKERNNRMGISTPPAIILTAAHSHEMLADLQAQPDTLLFGILTKPATPQQLASTVLHALQAAPMPATSIEFLHPVRRLEGLRLLVVEDNEINRLVAAELLASEGAHVTLACGGLDGVQKVLSSTQGFDVVILDVQMPDIDGLEATRRIRADGRFNHLPILAMTANISQSDREQCLAAGMNGHTGKPIDLDDLVDALKALWHP